MSDLIWLTEAQMRRIEPYFLLSRGVPRVDDRRIISGNTFVIQHHADRLLANLGCKLVGCLAHNRPFLSGVGASGNPGAVHYMSTISLTSSYGIEWLEQPFEKRLLSGHNTCR